MKGANKKYVYLNTLENKPYRLPKSSYYHLQEAKNRTNQKLDALVIITGSVGSGKSNKAMALGGTWENHFFEREYNLDSVHFSAVKVGVEMDRVDNSTHCINFDEAIQGGGSNSSVTKVGKMLRSKLITKRFKKHLILTTVDSLKELNDKIIERSVVWYHVYYIRNKNGKYLKGHFKAFSPQQALKVYEDLKNKVCRDTMKHPIFLKNRFHSRDDDYTELWYKDTEYDKKKAKETSELDDKEVTLDPKHVLMWSRKNKGDKITDIAKDVGIPRTTVSSWINKVEEAINRITLDMV